MAVKLSALRTGRALLRRNIISLFLVLIIVCKPHGLVWPEGLGKLKIIIHLIATVRFVA
jgi:hypothetical protein